MASRIQMRRGTLAQWTSANPILAIGESGYETDTNRIRIGDGTTNFLSLPFLGNTGLLFVTAPASKTDMSTLPGNVAPIAGSSAIALSDSGIWSIKHPETEWKFTDRSLT